MIGPSEFSIAEALSALDRGALRRLRSVLEDASGDQRENLKRDLSQVPHSMGTSLLGEIVAICDADRAARFEVLRGIRDALGKYRLPQRRRSRPGASRSSSRD